VYVVPTFSWNATNTVTGGTARTRMGGGLRVYLERPWWSSGEDELLGVVTAVNASGQSPLAADVTRFATQWGVDPVHSGAKTADVADPTRFPLRVATGTNLSVAEAPNVALAVAGHTVGFDDTRDLWYCDLQVDTGPAWMPFVRLALARYQASALTGLELSPIVQADFIQLAADRTATITPGTKPRHYNVQLTGPSYATTTADPIGLRATATVQGRVQGLTGPLSWTKAGARIELTRQDLPGPTVVYTGALTVSAGTLAAGARILFEEFEQVESDGASVPSLEYGNRPVYADAVELS
jgi:hypothetical protein